MLFAELNQVHVKQVSLFPLTSVVIVPSQHCNEDATHTSDPLTADLCPIILMCELLCLLG